MLMLLLVIETNVERSASNAESGENQRFLESARNDRKKNACLSHGRDDFEFDCNRRGQRADLNSGAGWVWLAGARKIFCVDSIVDWKIFFHVGQKHRDIDDVLPRRSGVFQHQAYVFERRAALRFNVVTDDASRCIERNPGNFLAPALARPDPG